MNARWINAVGALAFAFLTPLCLLAQQPAQGTAQERSQDKYRTAPQNRDATPAPTTQQRATTPEQSARQATQAQTTQSRTGQADKDSKLALDMAPQRASKLIGMEVQNEAGEDLGEIEDLVIDVKTGKVRYLALSSGGFLGLGGKLFAVPMDAMKLRQRGDTAHFVLNIDKDRLKTAPGFDENNWPDFGNAQWSANVDKFYYTGTARDQSDATDREAQGTHSGKVVSISGGQLIMSDHSGKQHTHVVGSDVRVTLDGKPARLSDLKKDHFITVQMSEDDKSIKSIDARTQNQNPQSNTLERNQDRNQ